MPGSAIGETPGGYDDPVPLPAAWSPRRRRQFDHIKASLIAQGRTPAKAAELAARTVNKSRRQAGEASGPPSPPGRRRPGATDARNPAHRFP